MKQKPRMKLGATTRLGSQGLRSALGADMVVASTVLSPLLGLGRSQQLGLRVFRAHGVVLLAGNGRVRKNLGVPHWLPPALQARTRVVGFVEAGPAGLEV